MLYVKTSMHYKRRADLELRDIESIWIELVNNQAGIIYLLKLKSRILLIHLSVSLTKIK